MIVNVKYIPMAYQIDSSMFSLKSVGAPTGSTLLPKVVQIDRLPGGCHDFAEQVSKFNVAFGYHLLLMICA